MKKSFIVPAIGIICGLSYHMVKNWSRDGERYRQHSKIFRWGYIIGIVSLLLVIFGERLMYGELSENLLFGVSISDIGLMFTNIGFGIGIHTSVYWKVEEAKLIEDLELREKEVEKRKNSGKKLELLYWGIVLLGHAILAF